MNNQEKLTSYLTDIQGMVKAGMGKKTIRSNSVYILEGLDMSPDNAQILTDTVMEVLRSLDIRDINVNDLQTTVSKVLVNNMKKGA